MRKILLVILAAIALTASAITVKKESAKSSGGYKFWLVKPEIADSDTVAKPLVVFLHGASLCGHNLEKVRRYGTLDAAERGRKIDAFILAPQNPGGSWKPDKIMELVDWAREHNNIDSTRVYVLGMSLGGYGTMDVAAAYPDRIAAAIAMCGGSTAGDVTPLNRVPLWIIHGTADRAVSVKESDRVVSALEKADTDSVVRLHYDRIAGMNHGQPARMFYVADTYDWLLSHSLADSLRPISPTFDVSQGIRSAYRDLKMPARKKKATKKRTARRKRRR